MNRVGLGVVQRALQPKEASWQSAGAMAPPAPQPIAAPEGARCSLHPDRPALLACQRCGAFICEDDQCPIDGALYCPPCAARPDVDYLDAFRLKHWGVRDSWAWLFGLGALLNAAIAIASGVSFTSSRAKPSLRSPRP